MLGFEVCIDQAKANAKVTKNRTLVQDLPHIPKGEQANENVNN